MENKNWKGYVVAGLFGALACIGLAKAATSVDPTLAAGMVYFFSGGTQKFQVGTNPSIDDSIRYHSMVSEGESLKVSTDNLVGVSLGVVAPPLVALDMGANKSMHVGYWTTAQIQAGVPHYTGEFIWNATNKVPCFSTATTVNAWVKISTYNTTTGAGKSEGCDQ